MKKAVDTEKAETYDKRALEWWQCRCKRLRVIDIRSARGVMRRRECRDCGRRTRTWAG